MHDHARWNALAAQLGIDSIRATTAAGSGHPTSCLSAAHLAAVLFADHLRLDVSAPRHPANDRFILSKGHAAPLLYAALKAIGAIDDRALLTLRQPDSPLQGHPVPLPGLPWVEVATGSLGQGLSMGLGMSLAMRLDHLPGQVWVLLGDSEVAEGSIWEALAAASFHGANRLHAILDMNRLGQTGPTMLEWRGDVYAARARAFGWQTHVIDGHDVEAIDAAYRAAQQAAAPTLIVARTVKGHGVSLVADQLDWHGKALSPAQAEKAIAELGGAREIRVTPAPPPELPHGERRPAPAIEWPRYERDESTRTAFGDALAALAAREDVVVLDAEVRNSTRTDGFAQRAPGRFFEMYIAEQDLIGTAVGLQVFGKRVFAATFGAFFTRAADQLRMAALSRANLLLCGSHAGVSIGEDGPSQMALEDVALLRAVHGSTVLAPADANSTVRLMSALLEREGICYLRTLRDKTPRLYGPDEAFPIGGSKLLRTSPHDRAALIGAGVTVFEALAAAEQLHAEGIEARVIDAYSIKPIDGRALRRALDETGLLVVAEDHWRAGGLGDAVLDALAADGAPLEGRVIKLAVDALPGSAPAAEQRRRAGIDAAAIAAAVREALLAGQERSARSETAAALL